MRIYKIVPGPVGEVEMSGAYGCKIVGIDCPECGVWGGSVFRYPTVECATIAALGDGITKHVEWRKGHVGPKGLVSTRDLVPPHMTVDEYRSLKASLEPILGKNRPVLPGILFGPLTAVVRGVRGKVGDFIWGSEFSPYVRESVFEEMQDGGFPISGARANLTFKRKDDPGEPLISLEIPPAARLAPSVEYIVCEICGRMQVRRKIIIDRASFAESIPIQRLYERPTLLVISESFAKFIRHKRYSGVRLTVQESG